jgi:hypothetical protein
MNSRRRVNSDVRWLTNSMKRALPFLVCSLLMSVNLAAQTPANRAAALRTLKGCATQPITLGCSEDTAGYLIGLYDRGDDALLRPLLDAGIHSDGALSEMLGDFYSNVLSKNTRSFLSSLRSRPVKQQAHLCWMAGDTDGSGMGTEMLRDVRHSLRVISSRRNDALSSVARVCMANVNRANASNQR